MHRVLEQLRRQLTPRRRDVAVVTFDAAAVSGDMPMRPARTTVTS